MYTSTRRDDVTSQKTVSFGVRRILSLNNLDLSGCGIVTGGGRL